VAPNAVAILGSVNSDGTVQITSTSGNVLIKQDNLAWLDYDFRDQGLQFQDAENLPARAFLGEGATTSTLVLDDYYTNEDDTTTVNNIMMSENNQLLIKE
jgi:ABC-type antimicrobial peptide transport system ATPase subunit